KAQHTIRAIAVVADSYRADRSSEHTFRPDGVIVFDTPRLYGLADDGLSVNLATLGSAGRVTIAVALSKRHAAVLPRRPRLVEDAQARGLGLALEDLSGIRQRTNSQPRTRKERGRANSWAFAQLRLFIAYKARAAGVPLVIVPAAYTSQTCHVCLHLGQRTG